jgi:RNA-directed DNA polymerase
LLANIYLSVLDRHFQHVWEADMSPHTRRQQRRRKGLPNYRLVRYADDFVVLIHGTEQDAQALREEIAVLVAEQLRMTLSVEKTHITHIADGFDFLGFRIQQKLRADGRLVVRTWPSMDSLEAVKRKIKQATGRSTLRLSLGDVLWHVNPILRGWAAYYRHGVSKRTFSYLGYYTWWRMILWLRRKHPRMTWKQTRRRYYGADRITDGKVGLYNPAKMQVTRYRFRGAQICTPYNIDEVDPNGSKIRNSDHDDMAFVGRVPEQLQLAVT